MKAQEGIHAKAQLVTPTCWEYLSHTMTALPSLGADRYLATYTTLDNPTGENTSPPKKIGLNENHSEGELQQRGCVPLTGHSSLAKLGLSLHRLSL